MDEGGREHQSYTCCPTKRAPAVQTLANISRDRFSCCEAQLSFEPTNSCIHAYIDIRGKQTHKTGQLQEERADKSRLEERRAPTVIAGMALANRRNGPPTALLAHRVPSHQNLIASSAACPKPSSPSTCVCRASSQELKRRTGAGARFCSKLLGKDKGSRVKPTLHLIHLLLLLPRRC